MNCQQINKHIFDYCDGQISPEIRREIESHLRDCRFCRNNEKLTRLENELLSEPVDAPALSSDFTARVMQVINSHSSQASFPPNQSVKRKKDRFKGIYHYWSVAAVAAIMLLALLIPGQMSNQFRVADDKAGHEAQSSLTAGIKPSLVTVGGRNENTGIKHAQADGSQQDSAVMIEQQNMEAGASPDNKLRIASTDGNQPLLENVPKQVLYDGGAAGDVSLKKPAAASPSREKVKLANTPVSSLRPLNIPAPYQLTRVINEEGKDQFIYTDNLDNKEFTLQVAPLMTDSDVAAKSLAAQPADNIPSPAGGTALIATPKPTSDQPVWGSSLPTSVNWKVEVDNKTYDVVLTGNLTVQEMSSLSNLITFK